MPSAKNSEWNPAKNASHPVAASTPSPTRAISSQTAPANSARRTPPGLVRCRYQARAAHTRVSTTRAAVAASMTIFTSVMWETSAAVKSGCPSCVSEDRYREPAALPR